MHRIFTIEDIVIEIISHLSNPTDPNDLSDHKSLHSLALTCHTISEPALDVLWRVQPHLENVFSLAPQSLKRSSREDWSWVLGSRTRIRQRSEWVSPGERINDTEEPIILKYSSRIRKLTRFDEVPRGMDSYHITPSVITALLSLSRPFLPNLQFISWPITGLHDDMLVDQRTLELIRHSNLESLRFTSLCSSTDVVAFFGGIQMDGELGCKFNSLRSIVFVRRVDLDLWRALASLPNLCSLNIIFEPIQVDTIGKHSFSRPVTDPTDTAVPQGPPRTVTFSALRHLNFQAPDLTSASSYLNIALFPRVTHLQPRFPTHRIYRSNTIIHTSTTLPSFLSTLSRQFSHNTLQQLRIGIYHPPPSGSLSSEAGRDSGGILDGLRLLLAFRKITVFSMFSFRSIGRNEGLEFVEEMKREWKYLKEWVIIFGPDDGFRSSGFLPDVPPLLKSAAT